MSNKSRSVLVTGANRGLGLEFARQYKALGWQVYGTVRSESDLGETRDILGEGCTLFQADVSKDEGWHQVCHEIGALDLLINNAGVNGPVDGHGGTPDQQFGQIAFDHWTQVLEVNLIGQVRVSQALLRALRAGSGKQIVFISSLLGSIERAGDDKMFYRTSKAALNMAGKVISQNLRGEGFRVGAICPGWVRTRMGGEQASLSTAEAIERAMRNFERMKPGQFVMRGDDGEVIPW